MTPFAFDLYARLIPYADDYGRFNSDLDILRARLYPHEFEVVQTDAIVDAFVELRRCLNISFYRAMHDNGPERKVYGYFPDWEIHCGFRYSKNKCPVPTDPINDWALRRFIPMEMKIAVFERDGFKCHVCKKLQPLNGVSIRDAIKERRGLFDVDHIVPVKQGGRATLENLRLTCGPCNRSRPKFLTVEQILRLAKGGEKKEEAGGLFR